MRGDAHRPRRPCDGPRSRPDSSVPAGARSDRRSRCERRQGRRPRAQRLSPRRSPSRAARRRLPLPGHRSTRASGTHRPTRCGSRSSRSSTMRCMRAGVGEDRLGKLAATIRRQILVGQRLRETADDRERSLELMRDVGHEVAPHSLESPGRRQVEQGHDRPSATRQGSRRQGQRAAIDLGFRALGHGSPQRSRHRFPETRSRGRRSSGNGTAVCVRSRRRPVALMRTTRWRASIAITPSFKESKSAVSSESSASSAATRDPSCSPNRCRAIARSPTSTGRGQRRPSGQIAGRERSGDIAQLDDRLGHRAREQRAPRPRPDERKAPARKTSGLEQAHQLGKSRARLRNGGSRRWSITRTTHITSTLTTMSEPRRSR